MSFKEGSVPRQDLTPAPPQQEITSVEVQEIQKNYEAAIVEFNNSSPDLTKIVDLVHEVRNISGHSGMLQTDIQSILIDIRRYYKSDEEKRRALESRRSSLREGVRLIRSAIQRAEPIIESDSVLYGLFEKKIEAAKKIVSACEQV